MSTNTTPQTSAPQFHVPLTAQSDEIQSGGGGLNITKGENANAEIEFLGKKFVENKAEGVILPAFDYGINFNDPTFWTGAADIRMTPHQPDPDVKQHLALSHFFTRIEMFEFMHPTKETILSPMTHHRFGVDAKDPMCKCPLQEIFFYANRLMKDGVISKSDYERYTKGATPQDKPIIPRRRTMYVMNVWYRDTKHPNGRNVLLLLGTVAYREIRAAINEQLPAAFAATGIAGRDADHPTYFLGDVTKPAAAVVWEVIKKSVENVANDSNCLEFGGWAQGSTGVAERSYQALKTMPITPEMLKGRKLLHVADYWNIPTPQEVVDYILKNMPEIPYDWVVGACSRFAEVNPPANGNVTAAPVSGVQPPTSSGSFAQPTAQTPPPMAPAATPEREYWVAEAGVTPILMKEEEAKTHASNPAKLFQLVGSTDGAWKSGEEIGLYVPAPAAPSAPATPQQPAQTELPMPAAAAAPPQVEAVEEVPMSFTPTLGSGLTPEEVNELAAIEAEFASSQATGQAMNPRNVSRRGELLAKRG